MKTNTILLLAASIILGAACSMQPSSGLYFTMDEMPDLVKCLPAPPEPGDPAFQYDLIRYEWGKAQRLDSARAAQVRRDAVWVFDSLLVTFTDAFGMRITAEETPRIHQFAIDAIATAEQIRVRPKAHYMRLRPFVRMQEPLFTVPQENEEHLAGEGSYPSGHTIRGWVAALVLSEVNPDAAEALYARGWEYGESRVIAGAHWQSDVDASRAAASIAFAKLQTSPVYRKQLARAKAEFRRLGRKQAR